MSPFRIPFVKLFQLLIQDQYLSPCQQIKLVYYKMNTKQIKGGSQPALNSNATNQKQLLSILEDFQIQDSDSEQFIRLIHIEMIPQSLQFVNKSKRKQLELRINNYIKQKHNHPEPLYQLQTKQEFLNKIFSQKYGLDKDDLKDVLAQHDFNEENIQKFIECAKKKYRLTMEKQIREYFLLLANAQMVKPPILSEQEINQNLSKICIKFGIDDDELKDCLQSIKENKIEEYKSYVKKAKRQEFSQLIEEYLDSYVRNRPNGNSKSFLFTIKVDENIKEVKIDGGVDQLKDKLNQLFQVTRIQQYTVSVDGRIVKTLGQIFKIGKDDVLIKFTKKREVQYRYKMSTLSVWLDESESSAQIQQIVEKDLKNKKKVKTGNHIFIKLQDLNKNQVQFSSLKQYLGNFKTVSVTALVEEDFSVKINFEKQIFSFVLKSTNTIHDLKMKIGQNILAYERQELELLKGRQKMLILDQEFECRLVEFCSEEETELQFYLSNHQANQYFGFNANYHLCHSTFFGIEAQISDNFQKCVEDINFQTQQYEEKFFESFFTFFLNSLQRGTKVEGILEQVKKIVLKSSLNAIWISSRASRQHFINEYFVVMHLLQMSDSWLKIQILSLLRDRTPLPLFINQSQSIYEKREKVVINDQIIWVIPQGITVCSFGLHTVNKAKQKGKSSLINNIFETNFPLKLKKHRIIQGIPYISFKKLGDETSISIIDIPQKIGQEQLMRIVEKSDIVIIHSWQGEELTRNVIEKSFSKTVCFAFLRDVKSSQQQIIRDLKLSNIQEQKVINVPNLSDSQSRKVVQEIIKQKVTKLIKEKVQNVESSRQILKIVEDRNKFNEYVELNKFLSSKSGKSMEISQFLQYQSFLGAVID